MTPPGDDSPADRRDDSPDDRREGGDAGSGGLLGAVRQLVGLLREMEESGERRREGRGGAGRVSYDYSVGTLEDRLEGRTSRERNRSHSRGTTEGDTDRPTNVVETDEGVVVHVDVPEAEGETVKAGVDGQTLVAGVGNTVLARVPLPRPGLAVEFGRYNNGVLECVLRPTDEADPA